MSTLAPIHRLLAGGLVFIWLATLSGCNSLQPPLPGTPIPTEKLPTIVALTLQAVTTKAVKTPPAAPLAGVPDALRTPSPRPAISATLAVTLTAAITHTLNQPGEGPQTMSGTEPALAVPSLAATLALTASVAPTASVTLTTPTPPGGRPATATPKPPTPTRTPWRPSLTPTPTVDPNIPDAAVQIYRLGELSRVTSPLSVNAFLGSQWGKRVIVELRGEDGRVLVRQVKEFTSIPWAYASLQLKLDFEIAATAEVGRLVISVEDREGRVMALNSVNLILLRVGQTDLNPATALKEAIYIHQPYAKSMIQGGHLFVTGVARPDNDQPLLAEIIAADGRIISQRLFAVGPRLPGGYGDFAVEIPYSVTELTPVRLVLYERGEVMSPMVHLSSIDLMLSP